MRPLHVLIADDDASNREVALIMLRSAGHTVTTCDDGAQALERCLDGSAFDVILLDIMMPELDGLTVARRLREHPATRRTPIVGVSARAREEDRQAGLAAGCDYYLTKPFRRQQLLSILAEIATRLEPAD